MRVVERFWDYSPSMAVADKLTQEPELIKLLRNPANIYMTRLALGLSTAKLARLADVSDATVVKVELVQRRPSLDVLGRIWSVFLELDEENLHYKSPEILKRIREGCRHEQ